MSKDPKFLLVNLPPWAQENPHIGVGYICSYLRKKGLSPKVLDLNKSFFISSPDFRMLWHVENKSFWSNKDTFPLIVDVFSQELERAVEETVGFDPDIIGFSVVDPKERLTIELIKRIKKRMPGVKIVLGGPATSTEEQRKIFLDNVAESIDVFVLGEGEQACFEVVSNISEGKKLENIAGTLVQNNGEWVSSSSKPVEPLDEVSFPSYEEFDMSLYGKSLLVEWSRGCYSRCSFCKNWRLFPCYRAKSPGWVLEELLHHNQVYGIEEFTVVDSVLNGSPKDLYEICSLIIENNLRIIWSGQIAPRKDMDYEFFLQMRRAGCHKLQIGVESASNRVLKNMRKSYTSEMSEYAIRNAKRAGIETELFIIIGFPGESEREFRKTYNFVKRNRSYIDTLKSINTLHLIAGTEVYEKSSEKFNMEPLPEENWHYLWKTRDGNAYPVRKKRTERLLDLAADLGIKVMEANIHEGKENILDFIRNKENAEESISFLKNSINNLQKLPQKRRTVVRRRSLFKWLLLGFIWGYTFFYIIYFWCFMILRKRILLGGRRK